VFGGWWWLVVAGGGWWLILRQECIFNVKIHQHILQLCKSCGHSTEYIGYM